MFINKISFTLFIIFSFGFTALAQNKALQFIDQKDLKQYLTYIASDELQGRKLGADDDGLERTANYLAEYAKRIGLKPAGESYFQPVNVTSLTPNKNRFIEIKNEKGKSVFRSASLINLNGAKGNNSSDSVQIVLAGFGTEEINEEGLEGKIVVIAQGNSETFKQDNNIRWNNSLERAKIETLTNKNPKVILIVTNPHDKENKTFSQINRWFNRQRFQVESTDENEATPIIITTPDFADALLDGKGEYEKYLADNESNSLRKLTPVENKNVFFEIAPISEPIEARNVIGVVEGSDPELKKECVVFMAHYDHLGVDNNGDVFNGADDNGSGTVTLMEVAEAFLSLEQKPKRSILFLWVTGEEVGMLGSHYYVENPVFPMEQTVTCINIDMDGRVFEPRDSVWKRSPKMVKDFDGLFTLANDVWPGLKEINSVACEKLEIIPDYSLPENFLRSSDHYSFYKNGVPILNYATGYHADYHKVTDEVSKINFDKMKRVADLCFLVGYEIANLDSILIQ